jgi:hypothetical protein
MMEARLPANPAESSKLKPGTARGAVENILRWLAKIAAAFSKPTEFFPRPRHPASDITAERRTESAVEEAGAVATATESVVAKLKPITTATFADHILDQQEIQRRRDLVRILFNDFWSGSDNRPTSFVDRLDQAETYLNERLTACGEFWQLDATTRKMLGLPQRSNSNNEGNRAAHH